jgi:DNA-binding response OmpR family regulator
MKILLVEDNQLLAEQLCEALTLSHFTVDIAINGLEAWDYLETLAYDLVILDWMMPKMDGMTLCRRLRDRGNEVPILMMTARGMRDDRVMGLDCGADDYLVKPVSIEELTARIRALLRRSTRKLTLRLEWRGLCLDPNTCQVTYNAQPIVLTPKEYGILELLLRNPQRIYSRQAILEQLWPFSTDLPGDDTIKSHIKSLRQKLKSVGVQDLIETIYGMGYRLNSDADTHNQQTSVSAKNLEIDPDLEIDSEMDLESYYYNESFLISNQVTQTDCNINLDLAAHLSNPKSNRNSDASFKTSPKSGLKVSKLRSLPQSFPCAKILLVDQDIAFARKLQDQATETGIQLKPIAQLDQIAVALRQETYDLLLLSIPRSYKVSDLLPPLVKLLQTYPTLPIIALTDEQGFSDRQQLLAIANQGLLDRTLPAPQLLSLLKAVIETRSQRQIPILVMTGNQALHRHLAWLLTSWNCDLLQEEHPEQLWSALEATNPHLLIVDSSLTTIATAEICQVLRMDLRWTWLPIIILGNSQTDLLHQCIAAGADDFIQQPIVETELVNSILNRVQRSATLRQHYESLRSVYMPLT